MRRSTSESPRAGVEQYSTRDPARELDELGGQLRVEDLARRDEPVVGDLGLSAIPTTTPSTSRWPNGTTSIDPTSTPVGPQVVERPAQRTGRRDGLDPCDLRHPTSVHHEAASLGSVVLAPSQSVTPARLAAFTVLRRVAEQGAYADRALHTEARDLVGRDRAFARQLTFGTIQRLGSLDHHIADARAAGRQARPAVAAALRLGLYQLLFLDGVPDHAAVTESVELAKSEGESRGGHRLVNAVLRRAARERPELPGDATPADAAIHHSQPRWIVDLWWEQFGAEEAREMLASTNRPAELALRVNTLVTDPESLASALPVPTRPATELPDEGLVVEGPFDAHSHPLFAAGAYQPQSRASMRVAPALDPQPGERILDLCAAPGGKTTHMAARMGDRGDDRLRRAPPRPGEGPRPDGDPAARELGAGDDGRRRAAQLPARVRPGAHRSAVLRAGHAPGPSGPALAHDAGARRRPLRPAVPHRRARARGAAPGRDARLQHVHLSRRARTRTSSPPRACRRCPWSARCRTVTARRDSRSPC